VLPLAFLGTYLVMCTLDPAADACGDAHLNRDGGRYGDVQFAQLPLSRGRVMLMVYLTEDPAVTARLNELGWRHYPLE
jgi:hypothetical protein